jgi:hypothetical protein
MSKSLQLKKIIVLSVIALIPAVSFALPIDWHGSFGVDSTLISDYRRIESKVDNSLGADGSQEVALDAGKKASASWQSYVLKLSPTMVINDAATFFGELTTGYANGGYLGDSPQTDKASGTTNGSAPLYLHNQSNGSNVVIKKAYLELYSDTATYMIGRHTYEWGLGAIYNDGNEAMDRHATSRDGITMKLKIGNFHVAPFWSKVSNPGYTDYANDKEYGTGLLYDNPERDIAFGLLYVKKSGASGDTFYKSPTTTAALGETNVTVTDLYFKKVFGKFEIGAEVPLISGDLGKVTSTTTVSTYSAKAFLLQTNYKHTDSWTIGFDGGQISGDSGSNGTFGALYLNPNFQVANLLFRYNLSALSVSTSTASVYDSYMTNARYFKLRSSYNSEKWTFDTAVIYAKAVEVAKAGASYNHTKNKRFVATTSQSDSLGTEFDFNAKYHWNKEISIGTGLGYLFTGDYFGYTNTATANSAKNSLLLQVNTSVTF